MIIKIQIDTILPWEYSETMKKEITIYHGSNKIIKTPEYGAGSSFNDYGRGFYCTPHVDIAKEWAVSNTRDGYTNEYILNLQGLHILDLCAEKYNILHWLTILLQNRTFDIQSDFGDEAKKYLIEHFGIAYQDYDVIVGYRADDSYFSFAQDFLNNAISLKQLSRAMYLGELGKQVVIKSQKAFSNLTFVEAYYAEREIWHPQKLERDSRARHKYFESCREPWKKGEIYMMQILEREMGSDDICI